MTWLLDDYAGSQRRWSRLMEPGSGLLDLRFAAAPA
jgi:hypothetical protein